jgi:hypothetical protein
MSESTIVFFPDGAVGPTNNCVGIGDVLAGGAAERAGLRDRVAAPRLGRKEE